MKVFKRLSLFILFLLIFTLFNQSDAAPSSRVNNLPVYQLVEIIYLNGTFNNLEISPDNELAIVTSSNTEIWKLDEKRVQRLASSPNGMRDVAWSSNGDFLFNGEYIFNDKWTRVESVKGFEGAWSPSDQEFLLNTGMKMSLWNTSDWSMKKEWVDIYVDDIVWMNENEFVTASPTLIHYMNKSKNEIVKEIDSQPTKDSRKGRLSKNPSSTIIAYASEGDTARLIAYPSGNYMKTLFGHAGGINDVAFSRVNDSVISCGDDGNVRIWWGPDYLERSVTVLFGSGVMKACDWSSDGNFIAAGNNDGLVYIWRISDKPIVADAGDDIITSPGVDITLDGSRSQGNISEGGYSWYIVGDSYEKWLYGKTVRVNFTKIGDYSAILYINNTNEEDSDTIKIYVVQESERPTVSITDPVDGQKVQGTITIRGTATDDIKVDQVFIRIANGAWQICKGTDEWSWEINTRSLDETLIKVTAKAVADHVESEYFTIQIEIDNPPPSKNNKPVVTIDNPEDGTEVKGIIMITGTASDDTFVSNVFIEFGTRGKGATGISHWFFEIDTTQVQDGWYNVVATCKDEFDLSSDPVTIRILVNNTGVVIDLIKPHIEIKNPTADFIASSFLTIEGTAGDDNKVYVVQVSFNNYTWMDADGTLFWNIEVDSRRLPNDDYTLTARAFDGKSFAYDRVNISVDNRPGESEINNGFGESWIPIMIIMLLLIIILLFTVGRRRSKDEKKINYGLQRSFIVIVIFLMIVLATIQMEPTRRDPHISVIDNYYNLDINNSTPDFTLVTDDDTLYTNEKYLGSIVILQIMYTLPEYSDSNYIEQSNKIEVMKSVIDQFPDDDITILTLEENQDISIDVVRHYMQNGGSDWDCLIDEDNRIFYNFKEKFDELFIDDSIIVIGMDGLIKAKFPMYAEALINLLSDLID